MSTSSFIHRMTAGFLLLGGLAATPKTTHAQSESDIMRVSVRTGYDGAFGPMPIAHKPFSAAVNFDMDRIRNTPFGITLSAKKYVLGNETNGGTSYDNQQINPAEATASLGASLRVGTYLDLRGGDYFMAGLFARNQFLLTKKPTEPQHNAPNMLQDVGAYFGIEGDRLGFRAEVSGMLNKPTLYEKTLANGMVIPGGKGAIPLYFGIGLHVNLMRRSTENANCSPF